MRYLNMAICLLSGAAVLSASAASGDGARFPEPCRLPAGVAFGHDASRKAFSLLADDVEVSRLKIVGQWRYNTDGIDVCNSRRVRIRDCFVRSFDDAVVIRKIRLNGKPFNWKGSL